MIEAGINFGAVDSLETRGAIAQSSSTQVNALLALLTGVIVAGTHILAEIAVSSLRAVADRGPKLIGANALVQARIGVAGINLVACLSRESKLAGTREGRAKIGAVALGAGVGSAGVDLRAV